MSALRWSPIDIGTKLFTNVDATQLRRGLAAIENAYVNEAGGHSRFPGLKAFTTLTGGGRVFVYEWRGALYAATSTGRLYQIDTNGTATDVTNVAIPGGKRVTFAETDDRLLMAGGGSIIQFDGKDTTILSEDAPETTHVGFLGSFVVAIEPNSSRFFHNETAGDYETWNPIDVFSADSSPDPANSLLVTEFNELLIGGEDSVEQWERGTNAVFAFRFAASGSVFSPYTLVTADNAAWALSREKEFVRISGQTSRPFSEDIGKTLEAVADWRDAWAAPISIDGQEFIILQAPYGVTPYGTEGMTFLFDLRARKWANLFVLDDDGLPTRWPGWSYAYQPEWNRRFVGSDEGVIYELVVDDYTSTAKTQRMTGRTAHLAAGTVTIEDLRMTVKRGVGAADVVPKIRLRVQRDNQTWSRWVERSLGAAGDNQPTIYFGGFGSGNTFQIEWQITDNVDVEIRSLEAQITRAE